MSSSHYDNEIAMGVLLLVSNLAEQLRINDLRRAFTTASRILEVASQHIDGENWAAVSCNVANDALDYIHQYKPHLGMHQ